jgi:hypothetical protein
VSPVNTPPQGNVMSDVYNPMRNLCNLINFYVTRADVASGGVMLNGSTPVPIYLTDKRQKSKKSE